VSALQSYNASLSRANSDLRRELETRNRVIRAILERVKELPEVPQGLDLTVSELPERSFSQRRGRLTQLQSLVYNVLVILAKHDEQAHQISPITNKRVVTAFQNLAASNPKGAYAQALPRTNPGETIGRRLRELRELGRVAKPTPETWYPIPEEEQKDEQRSSAAVSQ
jgi:hypothetical protein